MTRSTGTFVAVTATFILSISLSACSAASSEPSKPVASSSAAPSSTTATVAPAPGAGETSTSAATPTEPAVTASVIAENTLPPVPATAQASFGEGLSVRVVDQRAEELTATLPGEISGPGVVVHLAIHNGSAAPVDLDGIRVSAYDSAGNPAPALEGPPAQAATGVLAAGADSETTVAFSMTAEAVAGMTLEITSTSSADVVVLAG